MHVNELKRIIKPAVSALGLVLFGIEVIPGKHRSVMRVYIDKEGGVSVDDCTQASRQISAALDVDEVAMTNYQLEVSSPGFERILFEKSHYTKAIGQKIQVRLQVAIAERKNFTGILKEVGVTDITLTVDGSEVALPFADIAKAHVVAQW